jgi:hypothetical protein
MQTMVKAQLGMEELPEPSDAADALAVALCHLQTDRLEQRFGVRKSELARNAKEHAPKRLMPRRQVTLDSRIRIQPER